MNNLALPIFILIAALVILVFYFLIRAARQTNATRHLEAENLGFQPRNPPDPDFVARILALHQRRPDQVLEVGQVFVKPHGDTTFYLFDLEDTGGEDRTTLLDGAIAVVSPLLDLPAFGIFPKVPGDSFLAQMANRMVARLIGQQTTLVDFTDRPDFARRYIVTAADTEQVRNLLSDYLQDRLNALEMLQIQAGGDTLTIGNIGYTQKRPGERRDLETLYRQTLTVYDLLRRSRM